ncbi:MAG TPA: hypothetical protein VMT20_28835 [Terriglobia bacterium]|nr:hypothetical protein [Terriglobia bacterium]
MPSQTQELTWANVDVDNDAEMDLFRKQEERKADERIRKAFHELQEKGIIDAQGRRIRKDLPHDMREDSECDLG